MLESMLALPRAAGGQLRFQGNQSPGRGMPRLSDPWLAAASASPIRKEGQDEREGQRRLTRGVLVLVVTSSGDRNGEHDAAELKKSQFGWWDFRLLWRDFHLPTILVNGGSAVACVPLSAPGLEGTGFESGRDSTRCSSLAGAAIFEVPPALARPCRPAGGGSGWECGGKTRDQWAARN